MIMGVTAAPLCADCARNNMSQLQIGYADLCPTPDNQHSTMDRQRHGVEIDRKLYLLIVTWEVTRALCRSTVHASQNLSFA